MKVQIESREAPIAEGIQFATGSSARNGVVEMGGAISDTTTQVLNGTVLYSMTVGPRTEQNPYTAESVAIAVALTSPPAYFHNRTITVVTSNQAALLAIQNPQPQSGQSSIKQIYHGVRVMRGRGNTLLGRWVPSEQHLDVGGLAKGAAKKATELGKTPAGQPQQAKATILRKLKREIKAEVTLPQHIGKHSRDVDAALPGKHMKGIYDTLSKKEAGILAQLRTGMARINGYLHRTGVSDTDQCDCGAAKETVKHFLFLCARWDHLRARLLQQLGARIGDLSICTPALTLSGQHIDPNTEGIEQIPPQETKILPT